MNVSAADTFTPPVAALDILGLLAWLASAAGVAGLLITGMMMAVQLRRGEPGENGEFFRSFFYVILASLLAVTAGPIVQFLGVLGLVE
ncbi:MAG TPA: hypothetical protein VN408_07320 [Actinoplanes sp.]|nr:hypothetical protein [Actinoplanes sp.]